VSSRSVEFFDDPGRTSDEDDPGPAPRPRRRWPLPVALALCAVAALATFALRGSAAHPRAAHPRAAHPRAAQAQSSGSVAPTAAGGSRSPSPDQPPGCLSSSSCRVSRGLPPSLVSAVRRHFAAARPLTGYAVFRAGRPPLGGELQYRRTAFDVATGVLVITVRARSGEPPYPSFSLTDQGSAADLLVSAAKFDLDLRFTGDGGGPPVSGQRLVALSDESALTGAD
jgi:hypothetical protein